MSLALRLTPAGGPAEDPEDFFGDSLGVVFRDDTLNLRKFSALLCWTLLLYF